MTKLLSQMKAEDMSQLISFKTHQAFKKPFGIARIQRHLRIGYNRACWLVEDALKQGVIEPDGNVYRFSS